MVGLANMKWSVSAWYSSKAPIQAVACILAIIYAKALLPALPFLSLRSLPPSISVVPHNAAKMVSASPATAADRDGSCKNIASDLSATSSPARFDPSISLVDSKNGEP